MSKEGVVADETDFEWAMERIRKITGTRTQVELAALLDIRQSSISDAKRRRTIPDGWLVKLLGQFGASPVWILTGEGAAFLREDPERETPRGLGPAPAPEPVAPPEPTVAELVAAIEARRPESRVHVLPREARVVASIQPRDEDKPETAGVRQ